MVNIISIYILQSTKRWKYIIFPYIKCAFLILWMMIGTYVWLNYNVNLNKKKMSQVSHAI